ncbi:hypothetical protein B0H14DRAFT_3873953 [Mycena olivaceomarginata]|nr:hypothetical protein B0H14DRAFT_3873953 [Mycena olivaceomarginata]
MPHGYHFSDMPPDLVFSISSVVSTGQTSDIFISSSRDLVTTAVPSRTPVGTPAPASPPSARLESARRHAPPTDTVSAASAPPPPVPSRTASTSCSLRARLHVRTPVPPPRPHRDRAPSRPGFRLRTP